MAPKLRTYLDTTQSKICPPPTLVLGKAQKMPQVEGEGQEEGEV
jgi:hypothetical protein